jgi:hypothetical protein
MFEIIADSFPQDWKQDEGVQNWVSLLKSDPWVIAGSALVRGAGTVLQSSLRMTSHALHGALFPLTYPLSKAFAAPPIALTPSPFTPAPLESFASVTGAVSFRWLNFWERSEQRVRNAGNALAVARSPLIRTG